MSEGAVGGGLCTFKGKRRFMPSKDKDARACVQLMLCNGRHCERNSQVQCAWQLLFACVKVNDGAHDSLWPTFRLGRGLACLFAAMGTQLQATLDQR